MVRPIAWVCVVTVLATGWHVPSATGQEGSLLAGQWTLNRSLSEFPREIGFDIDVPLTPDDTQNTGFIGGGRRRGSAGGARVPARSQFAQPESYEDAQRARLLTADVRTPPTHLTVVDTSGAVTLTNELGQVRTFHPNGREESMEIQGVPFTVTAKRDGDRLVVVYQVRPGREVHYTYSSTANPARLVVQVQFFEPGAGDKVTRVYEPGAGSQPAAIPAQTRASGPSSGPETFDQRPGAEFRGIKSLGILVEDLGDPSAACGLSHDAIENAVSKRLTDSGMTVRKNSDDDTYVYVNVITTSVANGFCVSRYDAFLYTHATAKLSYHDQPVLVQVSLMHRGGIGSSAIAGHAMAVSRGLENFVDLFIAQIREANR